MLGLTLYQSICSSKGWLKPLLLFRCLCHVTPPCFCIYLFPPSCWGHAVLTWPGTSPGATSAHPSLGIPSSEKPPSTEMGAQRRGRGPCVLIPCSRASPISPAPTPLPRSFGRRGLTLFSWFLGESSHAIASSSAREPRLVSRCSWGAVLPEPRPFPRWSLYVCAHISTWHHLHFALLQRACAASKEGNKWCKGIYILSERGCWSVVFHVCC